MIHRFTTTIIVLILMAPCATFAQGPSRGQGGRGGQGGPPKEDKPNATSILKLLDTNYDDLIDKDEASKDDRGKMSKEFDTIDFNEDGFIDLEELEVSLDSSKPRKVSGGKLLLSIDQNEDGLLNELEVAAKDNRELMEKFSVIDINKDGQLDLEELNTFYAQTDDKKKKA